MRLLLSLLIVLASSCSQQKLKPFYISDKAGNGQSTSSSEDLQKQDPSTTRPSENGEGIPGYLVEPGLFAFEDNGTTLTIRAHGNAIKSDSLVEVPISIWELDYLLNGKAVPDQISTAKKLHVAQHTINSPFSVQLARPQAPIVVKVGNPSQLSVPEFEPKVTGLISTTDGVKWKNRVFNMGTMESIYPNIYPLLPNHIESKFISQRDCHQAGFYWNFSQNFCVKKYIYAKLQFCWPEINTQALLNLVKGKTFQDSDLIVPQMEKEPVGIVQCYFPDTSKTQFAVQFGRAPVGTLRDYFLPTSSFKDDLQNP